MLKVALQGHIIVSENNLSAVQAELPEHIELTRKEEGCLVFEVTQDKVNKNIFNVYEEFIDRTSFEKHQSRVTSSRWGQVTKSVERHYQIFEGK